MSSKRRNSSSPECESSPKRQRPVPAESITQVDGTYDDSDEVDVDERPQVHAFTGQAGAFPGLGTDNDELFYGPANDGLDYLRMVRSEAKGIPGLLRAQSTEYPANDEDVEAEDGGYWEEDAYIAVPQVKKIDEVDDLPYAQSRYYQILLAQYAVVRATMRCVPPLSAIEKLLSSQPISFPSESRKARYTWEQCLRTKEPSPTQVACMDESSVFELLRLVTKKMRGLFEKDDVEVARRIGAWIWAILGKCPDRGEMSSEEISDLRQLARKAADVRDWIMKKSRSVDDHFEDDEEEEGENLQDPVQGDTDDNMGVDIHAARTRLVSSNNQPDITNGDVESDAHDNDEATAQDRYVEAQTAKRGKFIVLDMIITIVSEVYGQRDLRDSRLVWE